MGLFAFLTASRLKVELTRQRDEIARLHQLLDAEGNQKQEMEKQAEQCARESEVLAGQCKELTEQLHQQEAAVQQEKLELQQTLDGERDAVRREADLRISEAHASADALRQDLESKQRRRSQTDEKNARLAENAAELQSQLEQARAELLGCRERIDQIQDEKTVLEKDMSRIVGNLNRW